MLIVEVLAAIVLPVLALNRPGAAVAATIPLPLLSFYGVSAQIYPVIMVVLLLAVLPTGRRTSPGWRRTVPFVGLAAVIAVQYAVWGAHSLTGNIFLVAMESALLAGAAALLTRPAPRLVLIWLAFTGTCYAILALSSPTLEAVRGTSVAGQNANGLGFLIAVGIAAAATLLVLERGTRWVVAGGATVALGAIGLMATSSITSGVVAGLGVVAAGVLGVTGTSWQRRRTLWLSAALFGSVLLLAVPLWQWFGGQSRDLAGLANSWDIRGTGTVAAWQLFWSAPFPGAGIGGSAQAVFDTGLAAQPVAPHNTFVGVASDLGVIALLLLLAMIVLLVMHLRCRANRTLVPVTVVYLAGALGIEWAINPALGIGFWVVAGTALAAHTCRSTPDDAAARKDSLPGDDQVIWLPDAASVSPVGGSPIDTGQPVSVPSGTTPGSQPAPR